MKKATFAPAYCAMYPDIAEIARSHGYALAIHGSLQNDFDLICIPWAEKIGTQMEVIDDICKHFVMELVGDIGYKNHGRIAYTLSIMHGISRLDLSFLPPHTSK